jgi:SAM-dependent methyltransferase
MQSAQFRLHADIEDRHWWFVARRRILQTLLAQWAPCEPDDVVIDVGCGTGANLASLAGDAFAVGVDVSGEAIDLARRRYPGLRFVHGSAPRDLPAKLLARARLIMLNDVLEHVQDDFALLNDLVEAARPGARFLLTVPAGPELWSPHDEVFGHFRRYCLTDFRALWTALPVDTLMVSYFNSRLYPLIRAARWWTRRRGQTTGQAGTDFSMPPRVVNALLARIMAGEAGRLARMARGGRAFRQGVSLVAILERRGETPNSWTGTPDTRSLSGDASSPSDLRGALAEPALAD